MEDAFIQVEKRGTNQMKGLMNKLGNMFVAATFAEAGEFETARDLLREDTRPQKVDRINPSSRPRKELRAPGMKR
jgi:hypothetical protein